MTQKTLPAVRPANSSSQLVLEVVSKHRVAREVVALTLASPAGERLPDWTPGSHLDLVLPSGATRQYSLCGDRRDPYTYRVAILNEPTGRGGSSYVHENIAEGSTVPIGGPRNNFRLVPSEKYIFVAGGIGITAMIPMIQAAEVLGAQWQLLYLGRSRRTMAFLEDLAVYGDKVTILAKDECGPSDLPSLIGPARPNTKIYACGPVRMLDALEEICTTWPEGSLRLEHFTAKEQGEPARKEAFTVELAQAKCSVTVQPDESVLDVLQGAGVNILSSCRTGTCGTCEVRVLAGKPDHRDSILTPTERAANDAMFPCVSRSLGERLVLDI